MRFIRIAVFCCGFMLCGEGVWGQNLVPNGSFESYTQCPSAVVGNDVTLAFPWTGPNNSSEYFNSCAVSSCCSVPYNCNGYCYQLAHTGNGYAGIFFYNANGSPTNTGNGREYLRVQLTDTLVQNQCYYAQFFVNAANEWTSFGLTVNNISLSFSIDPIQPVSDYGLINLPAHIVNFGNPIISDTVSWVKVSGIYQAIGGEKYITIGDFSDDAHTDTLSEEPNAAKSAFYYVDDVSVVPVDANNPMPDVGNDTAINQGDSIFIGTLTNGLITEWSDGAGNAIASDVPGLWVQPIVATDYILKQTVCGFVSYDTVHVDVWPLGVQDAAIPEVGMYPNPTGGDVSIMLPQGDRWQVGVYAVDGSRVGATQLSEDGVRPLRLRVAAVPGLYFVHISNTITGAACVRKLVVQ